MIVVKMERGGEGGVRELWIYDYREGGREGEKEMKVVKYEKKIRLEEWEDK